MYILKKNYTKCKDCGTCETILNKFTSIYGGIESFRVDDPPELLNRLEKARRAARSCPEEALKLTFYPD